MAKASVHTRLGVFRICATTVREQVISNFIYARPSYQQQLILIANQMPGLTRRVQPTPGPSMH